MLSPERYSGQMSKITNDSLTRSGTGCFFAVPIWQQWASNGYNNSNTILMSVFKLFCHYGPAIARVHLMSADGVPSCHRPSD